MDHDPGDADTLEPMAVPREDARGDGSRRRGIAFALPFVLVYAGIVLWSLVSDTAFLTVVLLAPGVAVFTAAVYLLGRGSVEG